MERWGAIAQRLRVPIGTILGLSLLWLMHPSIRSLWIGAVIAATGSLIRLWAAGHLEKGRALAKGGPYAMTRNPLYFGSLLMALGVLIAGQSYWLIIPAGVFFLAFYYPVMKREEGELLQGYGEQFLDYAGRVPLFWPGFRRLSGANSAFLWSRVLRNREHRALLGLVLAMVFLFWRIR
ncbi:MAG: isoprenylcysteine carboxylmethyltransferase family protein [Acidobacteria bacterium]|nr:isoprenylcysteine carboxylmethyltransferase family protein [Acidobacteriota bacterium]